MSLTISKTVSGRVAVLTCSGRMVLGSGDEFRKSIAEAIHSGTPDIVLNLAGVNYIDSSGLGELVSAYTTTRNSAGNFVLVGLTKRVSDLLKITRLFSVFEVFDETQAALDRLRSSDTARGQL